MSRKNLILLSALLVTIWLTWQSYHQENQQTALALINPEKIALPTRTLNAAQALPLLDSNAIALVLSARDFSASTVNLFATPPVAASIPIKKTVYKAPPPVAPPLPFKYIGRIQAGEGNGVMLNVDGKVMPIQTGDILLGQYKVQAINESAAGLQIQFLYVPLNQVQTLYAAANH